MTTVSITAEELIKKIQKAVKLEDILDMSNISSEYKSAQKLIHPDRCTLSGANEACTRLNELMEQYEKGKTYLDESGVFKTNGYVVTYSGNIVLLKKSFENYNNLKKLTGKEAELLHKYMPVSMEIKGSVLEVTLKNRSIPISGLALPQKHVNWILSRMLEFSTLLAQLGYTHCGLNPETVFITPADHGLQVPAFYMLSKDGTKANGISGKYKEWYPPQLFVNKKANPQIDIELAMKTAIYLLGDHSGVGIKLKKDKNVNQEILKFAIQQHDNPVDTWKTYREILSKNFNTKEFHILNI